MGFSDTDRKRKVRLSYDLPLLRFWEREIGHKLAYFGLTGEELRDVNDWQEVLAPEITAVEEDTASGRGKLAQMHSNAAILGVEERFQVLRGNIEAVISSGYDVNREIPQCSEDVNSYRRFKYDLVNLDFCGSLVVDRLLSIGEAVKRQALHGCVLFITMSPRSHMGEDLRLDIKRLRDTYSDPRALASVNWYDRDDDRFEVYRMKAVVPLALADHARSHRMSIEHLAPVTYIGAEGHRMVHFSCILRPQRKGVRGSAKLSELEIIRLPMIESRDDGLCFASRQVVGVQYELVPAYLSTEIRPVATPTQSSRRT